jgi:dihydroorotate dehydrogenase (NAD+) catalytic subunit
VSVDDRAAAGDRARTGDRAGDRCGGVAARAGAGRVATAVGSVGLRSAVMTASGTAGHGAELGAYGDLGALGAVVVKSLAAFAWPGNPGPRLHPGTGGSMVNSVGLQGPGVAAWRERELPGLLSAGAVVVASIWGRTVCDFEAAAAALEGAPGVVAVEVNVSCPNVEDRSKMFAHSRAATTEAVAASAAARLPLWAKLSPNVPDVCEIAGAALDAGAEAVTLVNTLLGMVVDVDARWPPLAGGVSGPAVHPVAVRAVYECRRAFPAAGIVGVGGVETPTDALELVMAGADAVQVGTATFADPRAPWRIQAGVSRWCERHRTSVREVVGAAIR